MIESDINIDEYFSIKINDTISKNFLSPITEIGRHLLLNNDMNYDYMLFIIFSLFFNCHPIIYPMRNRTDDCHVQQTFLNI